MNKKEKVSIVVPVYNGEKYINKCIDSILKQTYDSIELIIVNDGSTDDTAKLLKKYKKHENVTIINKNNTGVSDSRNIGIDKSNGKYIMFIDADDWLREDAIERALYNIKNKDAVRFSHYVVNGNKITKKSNRDDVYSDTDLEINNKELLNNLISNKTEGHLWNYLLKSDIIKNNKISFDTDLFYQEDVLFLLEYFFNSTNISVISDGLYYYYKNLNSATQKKDNIAKNLSSLKILRNKVLDLLNKYNSNLGYEFEQKLLNLQLMYFEEYIDKYDLNEFKILAKELADNNKEYYNNLLDKNILNKKWKIFILLLKYKKINLLYMYIKLYKKLKKK